MLAYALIPFFGILAGMVSGIIGAGASIILLPILVNAFGPKVAIPIMAIAMVIGNATRLLAWWRSIVVKPFLFYIATAVPAAIIGANTLWALPTQIIDIALACFFFALLPFRYWQRRHNVVLKPVHLSIAAIFVGFLTGLVFSTGPITVPLFAATGLTKGALLTTEAAASFVVYGAKSLAFSSMGGITPLVLLSGILVGLSLAIGVFCGKKIIVKMPEKLFDYLIDTLILVSACSMLYNAIIH